MTRISAGVSRAETLSRSNELLSVRSIQCGPQIFEADIHEFESTSPDRGSVVAAELVERPKQGLLQSFKSDITHDDIFTPTNFGMYLH